MARKAMGKASAWAWNITTTRDWMSPAYRRWTKRHLARAERRAGKALLVGGDDPEGSVVVRVEQEDPEVCGRVDFTRRAVVTASAVWRAEVTESSATAAWAAIDTSPMTAEELLESLVTLLVESGVDGEAVVGIASEVYDAIL